MKITVDHQISCYTYEMIAFGHTAVGSLVGLAGYNYFGHSEPLLGLALTSGTAIASHYLTDFIPHGHLIRFKDLKRLAKWAALFDFGLSSLIFFGLSYLSFGLSLKLVYLACGILASNLPGILDGLIYTNVLPAKGFLGFEHKLHELMHWHGLKDKALVWGQKDLWQIGVVIISLVVLIRS